MDNQLEPIIYLLCELQLLNPRLPGLSSQLGTSSLLTEIRSLSLKCIMNSLESFNKLG
jgi:hypothetical protein